MVYPPYGLYQYMIKTTYLFEFIQFFTEKYHVTLKFLKAITYILKSYALFNFFSNLILSKNFTS